MPTGDTTFLTPLAIAMTAAMCLLMVVLPRRYALFPVIAIISFMTLGEQVVVSGMHFSMMRVLALVGWVRILVRGEMRGFKMNRIDLVFTLWVLSSFTCSVLLWRTHENFINRLGFAYNALGLYFMFRMLIRDLEDIKRVFRMVALLLIPLAMMMLNEKLTGANLFSIFGGVSAITRIREGVLRCQGPFAHPILAGSFGATLCPLLFALLWQKGKDRLVGILGIVSALVVTITSASSGPAFALIFGLIGLAMWKWREHLRLVRWGIVATFLGLSLVMNAPVWFILGRVGLFAGSTGYHRAYIIDHFLRNFSEWWLVGVKDTAHWGALMADVTNEYVWQGVQGGLLTLLLFIAVIVQCFRGVGLTVRGMKNDSFMNRICVWVLGAALLAHVVNYLSIDYFDQNVVNWYLLLGMISTISGAYLSPKKASLAREVRPVALSPSISQAGSMRVACPRPIAGTKLPGRS